MHAGRGRCLKRSHAPEYIECLHSYHITFDALPLGLLCGCRQSWQPHGAAGSERPGGIGALGSNNRWRGGCQLLSPGSASCSHCSGFQRHSCPATHPPVLGMILKLHRQHKSDVPPLAPACRVAPDACGAGIPPDRRFLGLCIPSGQVGGRPLQGVHLTGARAPC